MIRKNSKILILIGIPASGKSTWAKDFVRYNNDWIRVSRDDFRLMLKSAQMCEPKIEDLITTLVDEVIKQALFKKQNVIVDATNLKIEHIKNFIDKFQHSADIDYRVFDISLDKALERDKNRQATVGEDVIKKMHKNYKKLVDSFDFQPVGRNPYTKTPIIPNFNSDKQDAIIFDIDGTLANMGDRDPYDETKMWKDSVNQIVAEQIDFHLTQNRKILLVTGRGSEVRGETTEWLYHHNIFYDELLMRAEGDSRKDSVVKKEIYYDQIEPKYNVLCVYDDRLSVLEMWYEEKIFSFNVNQGNILF